MAEGPGRGRGGRGAVIARLLELERKPGAPPAPPAGDGPSQPPPPQAAPPPMAAPPPRIGGRGAIMQRLLEQAPLPPVATTPTAPVPTAPVPTAPIPSAPVPTASTSSPSAPAPSQTAEPPKPRGRGKMMEMLALGGHLGTPPAPAPTPTPDPPPAAPREQPAGGRSPTDVRDITRQMRRIELDKPAVVMKGNDGQPVEAIANYIPLYLLPGRGIFEYEVRFSPLVDDRSLIEQMIFFQHKDILGGKRRTFDGVTLYLPSRLEVDSVTSKHPVTNEEHTISFIFRRERAMGECTHMYNVLFNNIQRELNLVKLGREYYSQELAHPIPQHRLEIWPGYVTAVDAFEGGIMLNCNASHKVLRTQTVLKFMDDVIHHTGGNQWQEVVQKQLIGQSVMTRNPVRIYRIDDIDFKQNPTSSFKKPDGTEMTYIEYHQRKNINIIDKGQPLLIHRPKPNKRPGGVGFLMLIPELCYLTGLTDEMRADFKVMKDVATFTRVNPNQRVMTLQKFIDNIKRNPRCVAMLEEWGLKVPESPIELLARILPPETISFGRGIKSKGTFQADWSRDATSQHMLEIVHINHWVVVHTQRDERNAQGFVEMMGKVCPQMGVNIEFPEMIKLRDDKTESYLRNLRDALNSSDKIQVVVVIFPSQREDRYSAIKKLCCVDRPMPSQVINSRTIGRPDKLRSIVQKIALQINCKLGGALWGVNIPFTKAMICGIDSYHDSKNRAKSVAGFVASMNKQVTRWHSQVFIQSSDREMVDGLRQALSTALNKYYEVNNYHPDTIVIFRDGVGDGQLKTCEEHEIIALKKAFAAISPDYNPALVFIVCQKRINTRFFIPKGRDYENPPPGSVMDHTVTRRTLYDFFLVSQMVRQGTVTPTHYIVLHNTTRLDPDKIQRLTYKMCHLYYNWPGTIRVPAPCQYAHKLAHLVGTSIHKEPSPMLCDKLFFL